VEAFVDRRRHAPVARSRAPRLADRRQGLPHVYLGRARRSLADIYDADHASGQGGRFRWILSTCLAATVGGIAIAVVIFGSLDTVETDDGMPTVLRRIRDSQLPIPSISLRSGSGLKWAAPKSDRSQVAINAVTAKQIIHEQIQIKRDNRPFIQIRPYVRIVTRLQPPPATNADVIPPFNPFTLYAAQSAQEAGAGTAAASDPNDVSVQVAELLGGLLPAEDGQEIETAEVTEIVARLDEAEESTALRPGYQPEGIDAQAVAAATRAAAGADALPANTTVLPKSVIETDEAAEDLERPVRRRVKVARGDTLGKILQRFGAEAWQARAMVEAARSIFPESALTPGQDVELTLVPSLTKRDSMEPARYSVFDGRDHKVAVSRNAAGDFVASASPPGTAIARAALGDGDVAQSSSLYASFYNAALTQGVPPDVIQQSLRIHAYDTDFRRRTTQGDVAEFFFDLREEANSEGGLGELLYTAVASGGEIHRFWRFRTPDAVVDYYDELGNTSKKFLMRRPVRGETVHLASGFGMRFHPILRIARPHNGIDWAGPIGTPILASGSGIIEEARFKGEFGNYIRIRHANGYQTAYAHMSRYAPNVREGARVRQGEVIGYIGATGLAEGPHLHFEVLVNSRHVDPLSIQVPRERQLSGRQLADFQKERARIDELMRRAPVSTENR
jgi:murein DD-endopeptidase MepM/ murein hydrolase activator NlpD